MLESLFFCVLLGTRAGPICVSYLDAGNLLLAEEAEALREVPGAQQLSSSASFWV